MTRLKSSLNVEELSTLIHDVSTGMAHNYTFVDTTDLVSVSTHEAVFDSNAEVVQFTKSMQNFLTNFVGKKVKTSRYNDHTDPSYSIFSSFFTSQSGLVRILWLKGKVLSVLLGSKVPMIVSPSEKSKTKFDFSPYFFGFSPDSKAALSLTDEDKALLMTIPMHSWFVTRQRSGITPYNSDANKSMVVADGYLRHGSLEKLAGNDDTFLLVYPKQTSNLFSSGGSYGSNLPSLVRSISSFDYAELLENQVVLTGEGSRYGDSDNSIFLNLKDVSTFIDSRTYLRFSFNSITEFNDSKSAVENKDLIQRKYTVLTDEDNKKYINNPRYDLVKSSDGMFTYIRKSDKLKATALQTRITKSLREDFISFLNWVFYFQLAADLDPAHMHESFAPTVLMNMQSVSWIHRAKSAFLTKKDEIYNLANEEYRTLYMNESSGGVCPYGDISIFQHLFKEFGSGSYHYNDTDPRRIMRYYSGTSDGNCVSFNKKFSLILNLPEIMLLFARGNSHIHFEDRQRLFATSHANAMSFMTTNFMLTTAVEDTLDKKLKDLQAYGVASSKMKAVAFWSFQYEDALKDGQLLRTMVHLSPEALMIFNSVANLATPTDIISWLELAKEYFITTLPKLLVAKYGNTIASESQISDAMYTGIEYYLTILSAAEPFSNKMLNTDETGD